MSSGSTFCWVSRSRGRDNERAACAIVSSRILGKRAVIILVLVLVLSYSTAVAGDKGNGPVVLRADLYVSDGLIVSDLTINHLFTDQVIGTVESGLPAVVELIYTLVTRENKTVNRGLHAFELRYDVWEDFYSIEGGDSTRRFSSFEGMADAIEHLRKVAIVPVSIVKPDIEYAVEFSIAVHPLRGREDRIVGWVGENVRSGNQETWREQVLNLNELIEHFFASGKGAPGQSEWHRTGFFNPWHLPVYENGGTSPGSGGGSMSPFNRVGGVAAPAIDRPAGRDADTTEEN